MAKLIHATGELEVTIKDIALKEGQLVIQGKMGVWDANIFVPREEVGQLARLVVMRPSILLFLLKALF